MRHDTEKEGRFSQFSPFKMTENDNEEKQC